MPRLDSIQIGARLGLRAAAAVAAFCGALVALALVLFLGAGAVTTQTHHSSITREQARAALAKWNQKHPTTADRVIDPLSGIIYEQNDWTGYWDRVGNAHEGEPTGRE